MDFTHQRSEETSSSEGDWEDWESDWSSEELFFPEDVLNEAEDTHILAFEDWIPRDVFETMNHVELREYILSQGQDPGKLWSQKQDLIDQAFAIQPALIEAEIAHFQVKQTAEINGMSQKIARVVEREKMHEKWIQRISTFEVRVPRLVVERLLKYVILLNDPKTINRARCINRHFKCVIESKPYVEAIRTQNKIRAFKNVLQEFDLYFGEGVYVTFVEGVGCIVDPDKVKLHEEWILKNHKSLYDICHRYTKSNGRMGLKAFRTYCADQHEMVCKRFKTQIETL